MRTVLYLCDMKRIKFPVGIANLEKLVTENFVLIDKTPYIELLEQQESFVSFLRPRRIGKSFFISLLEYYYDIRHKEKFQTLFGNYYIGQNPTPLASTFRVLRFNFSGLDTRNQKSSETSFLLSVASSIESFMQIYDLFEVEKRKEILSKPNASDVMNALFKAYKDDSTPIYLLIDEYDHFTNEILVRDLREFKKSVSKDGYVRKFYETIKIATEEGSVLRFFITGVSPITLDSLTSGFNIVTHLTHKRAFHDMAGFTEAQVGELLDMVLQDTTRRQAIIDDMKNWYNGYKFSKEAKNTIYNSNMTLFFLEEFQDQQKYPTLMLDPNIMPDYSKLKAMFQVANLEGNIEVLEEILRTGEVESEQIYQFALIEEFGKKEFVNFLFYLGNLTIKREGEFGIGVVFKIPNYVIAELYWQYYAHVLHQRNELAYKENEGRAAIHALARGEVEPYLRLVEANLKALSNRDFQNFDEKYVKMLMMVYAMQGQAFYMPTERETTGGGYIDLEIYIRPNNSHKHAQYIFEIKYIKKGEEKTFDKVKEDAIKQLKHYRETDTYLHTKTDLQAIVVIFVKDALYWENV